MVFQNKPVTGLVNCRVDVRNYALGQKPGKIVHKRAGYAVEMISPSQLSLIATMFRRGAVG
jgi:hypothetical protein